MTVVLHVYDTYDTCARVLLCRWKWTGNVNSSLAARSVEILYKKVKQVATSYEIDPERRALQCIKTWAFLATYLARLIYLK